MDNNDNHSTNNTDSNLTTIDTRMGDMTCHYDKRNGDHGKTDSNGNTRWVNNYDNNQNITYN